MNAIASFIKSSRKAAGLTQEELMLRSGPPAVCARTRAGQENSPHG